MTAPNVLDLVLGHAIRAPDAPAILANDRTTSFAALARTAAGVAAALGCRGIAVDAVVAVQVAEPEAALTIMLGAMLGGRIVLPLDRDMPPAERARILDAAGAAALVADDHQALPDRITALRPDDLAGSGDPAAERRPGGDRLAQIVLSSGTSGPSKLSPTTHAQLIERLGGARTALGLGPGDRYRAVVGMSFVLGRYPAMRTLDAGGSVVLSPLPQTIADVIAEIGRLGVTYLSLTPSHAAQMVAAAPEASGPMLPSVRIFQVSSAAFPVAIRQAVMARLTPQLHTGYGSNESGYITHATPEALATKPATVGAPMPGVTIEVIDDAGHPVPPGTIGEIRIRNPAAAEQYLADPAADARAFRDGWFHLGDTGHLDEDGYLYLSGRLDDRINFGGRKLYPFEIEEALLSHPDVAEAAALALRTDTRNEVPAAAVVLHRPVEERALMAHCRGVIGAGKTPVHIVAFDALPRNAARKVLIPALRKAILDRVRGKAQ